MEEGPSGRLRAPQVANGGCIRGEVHKPGQGATDFAGAHIACSMLQLHRSLHASAIVVGRATADEAIAISRDSYRRHLSRTRSRPNSGWTCAELTSDDPCSVLPVRLPASPARGAGGRGRQLVGPAVSAFVVIPFFDVLWLLFSPRLERAASAGKVVSAG